jgi:hypothetical protein
LIETALMSARDWVLFYGVNKLDGCPLEYLEEVERTFYAGIEDASRPDFLDVVWNGEPRPEESKLLMREVWRMVREQILPAISYVEPTGYEQVRDVEFILICGKGMGGGKSCLETFMAHMQLSWNPWIRTVWSTMPLFAGDLTRYPFPLRDDEGLKFLHPKYEAVKTLRDIGTYDTGLLVLDELDNLMPGREWNDQRVYLSAKIAKELRKSKVGFIATVQYPNSPDPLIRQNVQILMIPELDKRRTFGLEWISIRNIDADFSGYKAWKEGFGRELVPHFSADDSSSGDSYPYPRLPWLFAFYDTFHKVPIMFQAPLDRAKAGSEASELLAWLKSSDSGGIFTRHISKGDEPPKGEFNDAVRAWNVETERLWSSDELLLITQEFLRVSALAQAAKPPNAELPEETPRLIYCECGAPFEGSLGLERHHAGLKSYMNSTNASHTLRKFERLKLAHPVLFGLTEIKE